MISPPRASTKRAVGYWARRSLSTPTASMRRSRTTTAPFSKNWFSAFSVTTVPLPIKVSAIETTSFSEDKASRELASISSFYFLHLRNHLQSLFARRDWNHASGGFGHGIHALEAAAGDEQDHALVAGNLALVQQAQQAGVGGRAGWLSEYASQASQLFLRRKYLFVADKHAAAFAGADAAHRHRSVARQANGDAIGNCRGLAGAHDAIAFQRVHQSGRAGGLYSNQARDARDQVPVQQVLKSAVDAADDAAIAARNENGIRRLPGKLLGNLQPGSLLALDQVGIVAGVAVVPAGTLAGCDTQVKRLIVATLHREDGRAAHQQLHDLSAWRVLRDKDHAGQTHRRSLRGQGGSGIAGRGAGDGSPIRPHDCDDAGAVLERAAGIARVVLEPELRHVQVRTQARDRVERRATNRQRRGRALPVGNGQQRPVAPDGSIAVLRQHVPLEVRRDAFVVKVYIQHA